MASRRELIQSEILLLRHQRGDRRALEELVFLWERPLFYYIRRLVDSEEDAWDVLQEVWYRVLRRIRSVRDPRSFSAWVYKIARNTVIDHWRKNSSHVLLPEDQAEPEIGNHESESSFLGYEAEDLHSGLSQLSLRHREALTLHFLEGFSLAEIGEITGAPIGTVKSRLHWAKKTLRDVLRKEAGSHE